MDNTGIRSRSKKYRRRVRNIRVGLTLFVICLIAVAIPVIREMLRKPAQITIQVADVEVTQGTALPSYTADVKIQDKDKNKLTKTYTAEDFAKDLQKGKDITISSKADSNIEGTYVITAKLSEKIKKELNGAWKKKAQVTIRNGTCTVKNPIGVWNGNKFKKYDGTYVTSDFVVSKGNTYYFDADGNKVTGWQTIENALYCFDKKGIMQKSRWITTDDGRAYLSDDGKALIGWQSIDGKEYYFDSKGIAATGELKLGLEKCKFSESGELLSKEKTEIDPGKPMVALTFDDGPRKGSTELIVDALKKVNGRATFFVVGQMVEQSPDLVKKAVEAGCQIGNHTYDHANLNKLGAYGVRTEVNKCSNAVYAAAGVYPMIGRPPYGSVNQTVRNAVNIPWFNWNVDTLDWKNRDANYVYNYVINNVKDGQVILMHDLHPTTAQAMVKAIPKLHEMGYQLVTIDEMAKVKGGYENVPGYVKATVK